MQPLRENPRGRLRAGASYALTYIGDTLYDITAHRAWLVLHRRECQRLLTQKV